MSARQLKVRRFWCGRILRRLYSRPGCDEIDFNSSAIPKKFERNGVVAVNVRFGVIRVDFGKSAACPVRG